MSFIESLKTKRHNKLMYLVSSYDQSVHYGVEFEPHPEDIEEIEKMDCVLCVLLN
mgnify:CR=1 FL=1